MSLGFSFCIVLEEECMGDYCKVLLFSTLIQNNSQTQLHNKNHLNTQL